MACPARTRLLEGLLCAASSPLLCQPDSAGQPKLAPGASTVPKPESVHPFATGQSLSQSPPVPHPQLAQVFLHSAIGQSTLLGVCLSSQTYLYVRFPASLTGQILVPTTLLWLSFSKLALWPRPQILPLERRAAMDGGAA